MSEGCALCEIGAGKGSMKIVFEDKEVIAFLKQKPATFGHIILTTKKHYTIMDQVPDFEINHVFKIANKLSSAVFEALGGGGTNIIVQNGSGAGQIHPHFCVEIIPRRDNDGLNFQWANKQLSEEEMSTVELTIKQETASLVIGSGEKKKEVVEENKETKTLKEKKGEENYLLKSLRRIP
jgi:histidine triad (HIT) family protein